MPTRLLVLVLVGTHAFLSDTSPGAPDKHASSRLACRRGHPCRRTLGGCCHATTRTKSSILRCPAMPCAILRCPSEKVSGNIMLVAGNILSTAENEERIRCHFQGKQYLGWKAVRDKLKELKERFAGRPVRSDLPPPIPPEWNVNVL